MKLKRLVYEALVCFGFAVLFTVDLSQNAVTDGTLNKGSNDSDAFPTLKAFDCEDDGIKISFL